MSIQKRTEQNQASYTLAQLSRASQMLAEARTFEDIQQIQSLAAAAEAYARAARLGLEAQNHAAEIKLRAERKAGEVLSQLERGVPWPGSRTMSNVGHGSEYARVLEETSTSRQTAVRWQQEAAIPEDKFNEYIAENKAERELTTNGLLRYGRQRPVDEAPELGVSGKYDVIVIDPPWPVEKILRDTVPAQGGNLDYPTLSVDAIRNIELPMADDCHVFLWTTQKHLRDAIDIAEGWGCRYVCLFVWHKPGGFQAFGLPQYNAEFIVYARKGSPQFVDTTGFFACFEAPRGRHSEKPEAFYETLRRVTAGRRLDVFSRRQIDGFSVWGNDVPAE